MSPEALARLREHVDYVFKDGELPESERLAHDLRALLDAYAEAVDALQRVEFSDLDKKCPCCRGWKMSPNGETARAHTRNCSLAAVLAKAGRR